MTSSKQKQPAGVSVIGSGYWGKNLVRNLYKLGALKLICDKNEDLLTQFKEQYPGIDTCVALSDVLSREDIQGIVIATPAETHYTLAREALLAGKHVYIEKPLVLREEDGQELITIAKKEKRALMVGHLLQYHPVFVHLKKLVQNGELGKINYIYSHRLNLGKIRREENILWSFAPHDISMILSLAGEHPESIQATGGNYLHKQIADVTTTHLDFPSGLSAHIFVSWLHPFKEQKLVVVGDKKMAVFDDTLPWADKLLLYPHKIKWQDNLPIPDKAEPEKPEIPEDEPLRLECEHFLNSMSNGNKPITDGEEGIRVLRVLNASQLSLDRNGSKILLSAKGIDHPDETFTPKSDNLYFSHETTIIDNNVEIGKDTKIWHFSHILPGSKIGEQCNIGQNVVVGPDVSIGNGCKIQNNISVYKGVTLEDNVFCGPAMVFTNVYNPRAHIRRMDEARPTLVKTGATLGANCTVVCGNTIGKYSFVGAGATVNKDVSDHALVVGTPAYQIGWVCECGEKLNDELHCIACDKQYTQSEEGLKETQTFRK